MSRWHPAWSPGEPDGVTCPTCGCDTAECNGCPTDRCEDCDNVVKRADGYVCNGCAGFICANCEADHETEGGCPSDT